MIRVEGMGGDREREGGGKRQRKGRVMERMIRKGKGILDDVLW